MKRLILFISLFYAVSINAQTYQEKIVFDSNNNIVQQKTVKVFVDDEVDAHGRISFKEKGKTTRFILTEYIASDSFGNKDNLTNITSNMFGYQETWCGVSEQNFDKLRVLKHKVNRMLTLEELNQYNVIITHRVLYSKNNKELEMWWIQYDDKRVTYLRR